MNDFEHVIKEYEAIIYHLIHKYQIRDIEGQFYQEGLIALWQAYQQHDEAKSKFSTYAYYCIAKCFLNKIHKESREQDRLLDLLEQVRKEDLMIEDDCVVDSQMIEEIRGILTANQWEWFESFVLQDQSVKTIANIHGVTENAVKNWGKLVRKKNRYYSVSTIIYPDARIIPKAIYNLFLTILKGSYWYMHHNNHLSP